MLWPFKGEVGFGPEWRESEIFAGSPVLIYCAEFFVSQDVSHIPVCKLSILYNIVKYFQERLKTGSSFTLLIKFLLQSEKKV